MPAPKPKVKRVCKQCGKVEYIAPSSASRPFCNRDCMADYYREHGHNRESLDPNLNPKAGFKSGEHNLNWTGGPVKTECANCGAPLERSRSRIQRSENHFCNPQCLGEWRRKTGAISQENSPNWKGGKIETHCANCGRPIERAAHSMERSEHHFCNLACHGEWDSAHKVGPNAGNWRGGPITDPCAWCGKPVTRPKAWARRSNKNRMAFCNSECQSSWWSYSFSGDGNPNWRGGYEPYYGKNWRRQRRKARKRDNHTCQKCGITSDELGQKLDVHHIRPFRLFVKDHDGNIERAAKEANKLSNLICYCRSCHMSVEHNFHRKG